MRELRPAAGSSFADPPLTSRFGWGCLAQRLRLEAYALPARSGYYLQDCVGRGDMHLQCVSEGEWVTKARASGISKRFQAKKKRKRR